MGRRQCGARYYTQGRIGAHASHRYELPTDPTCGGRTSIIVRKSPRKDNPADLYTKHLDAATSERHVDALNCHHKEGRSSAAPELHMISLSWDDHMKQQPEHNVMLLGKTSRDIHSQVIKRQSKLHEGQRGHLMTYTRHTDCTTSGCNAREQSPATQHYQYNDHGMNYFNNNHTTESRDKSSCCNVLTNCPGKMSTTNCPCRRLEIGDMQTTVSYNIQTIRHDTMWNTHYSHHVTSCRCIRNQHTLENSLKRTPREVPETRRHEQGHGVEPHSWTTTVSLLQRLEMYRGSMSSEIPISHCLGAASEGGGSETYRLYTHADM